MGRRKKRNKMLTFVLSVCGGGGGGGFFLFLSVSFCRILSLSVLVRQSFMTITYQNGQTVK